MEPSDNEWFITFSEKHFSLKLFPIDKDLIPVGISLLTGNVRVHEPHDIIERVEFPYSIIFCIYRDRNNEILGAFLPVYLNFEWEGC